MTVFLTGVAVLTGVLITAAISARGRRFRMDDRDLAVGFVVLLAASAVGYFMRYGDVAQ